MSTSFGIVLEFLSLAIIVSSIIAVMIAGIPPTDIIVFGHNVEVQKSTVNVTYVPR